MPVVDRLSREIAVSRLPDGLRKLCSGEIKHEFLEYRCIVPPVHTYYQGDGWAVPVEWDRHEEGPRVIPLWETGVSMIASREAPFWDFVEIDLEEPDASFKIAKSSQGLLGYLFFFLIEDLGGASALLGHDSMNLEALRCLADVAGFRSLNDIISLQSRVGGQPNWMEALLEFVDALPDK